MTENARSVTLAILVGVMSILLLYISASEQWAVFGGGLAILTLVAVWQPVVVLALIAFSLPLFHQPVEAGTATIAPSEILLGTAAIGTGVRAVVSGEYRLSRDWLQLRAERILQPFGLAALVSLLALSAVGVGLLLQVDDSTARSAGLRELRWTFVEPLLFVLLLLWHVSTRRQSVFIAGSFLAGGLLMAVWGLGDAVLGGGVLVSGVVRVDGPFPHPNAFALYLLRPVVLVGAYLVTIRSRDPILWVLCAIGGVALIASFSRSAALGLVVAVALIWPCLSHRLRIIGALGGAVLSILILAVAADRAVGPSGTDSLALRLDIWSSGIAMIRDRPILGYGPDQFLYVYTPRYIDPAAWTERFTSHGHNLLIDAWVRVGIIGAVLVALASFAVVRAAFAVRGTAVGDRFEAMKLSAVIVLLSAMVQGLVDNGYFVHDLAMSAWLLAWLAFARTDAISQRGVRLHERYRDRRRGTRRLAPLR